MSRARRLQEHKTPSQTPLAAFFDPDVVVDDVDELADRLAGEVDPDRLYRGAELLDELAWQLKYKFDRRAPELAPNENVVAERTRGAVTYRSELVRCGKANCRCAKKGGSLHGPYWYAYRRRSGRLQSIYVGKKFRELDDD